MTEILNDYYLPVWVADKIFLLTPRNVEVSAEERARLVEKGFFNQF